MLFLWVWTCGLLGGRDTLGWFPCGRVVEHCELCCGISSKPNRVRLDCEIVVFV